jgi:hypothetical protein
MLLHEHRHSLKEGLLEKLESAKHANGEGHGVVWDEARILEIESNCKYRKHKESTHVACLTNPIIHPSLDSSTICIPFISNEVTSAQRRAV